MTALSFDLACVSVTLGETPALREVDLAIRAGEAVAVLGPSGAGKTTLLRLLAGAAAPTSGSVAVDGVRLDDLTERERRALRASIGFVHQDHALVPALRVLPNILAGRLGAGGALSGLRRVAFPSRAETEEVHALLERVGLDEQLYQRADRLSGGQQQRVAIARALYQEPQALLADEPVASVDPVRSREIIELLIELAREHDATLVASLHDVELARAFFPRIVGLRAGRVQFDARANDCGGHDGVDAGVLARLFATESTGR